jgi:hypothetical protein
MTASMPPEPLDVTTIVSRTALAYATCASYRDSGSVTVRQERVTIQVAFSTAFVRPDSFCFEHRLVMDGPGLLRDKDRLPAGPLGAYFGWTPLQYPARRTANERQHAIWLRHGDVRQWWSWSQRTSRGGSLGRALAAATGVSMGSAHDIPRLLLPEAISGRRVLELKEPLAGARDDLAGRPCVRIWGASGPEQYALWLDAETFLIRQIQERHDLGERTSAYEPEVNVVIPASALRFDPPS